ncbi:ABC transporter ATP-binding protein [Luminiphilus sp.]|nr:ABC transporter ATP-binding protein [Luminiphilus sp.]
MISLKKLSREFQVGDSPVLALRNIDLTIEAGEYVSIMGPSGSGKSTLLNMLGLIDRPSDGEYFLKGEETSVLSESDRAALRRAHIGFVFQAYHLVPRLTARENIELPLMLDGVSRAERRSRADTVMQQLNLSDRAHHLPNQLSGGQRQRVAIGRSIIMHPSLLLADEPTGNLDSRSGQEVTALLETLNASGLTLIVVTHDNHLGQRATRQLSMLDGEIAHDTLRNVDLNAH